MWSENFKSELSALKKIIQLGKRFSPSSEFILNGSILYGYDPHMHISICELNDKIGQVFPDNLFIKINGGELYSLFSSGKFEKFEETNKGITLWFSQEKEVTPEFNLDEFADYCEKKGFTKFDAIVASGKGWTTNFDIYQQLIRYKKTLEPHMENVLTPVILEYVTQDDDIMTKVYKNLIRISTSRKIHSAALNEYELDAIKNSDGPVLLKYWCYGEKKRFRLMRNMLPCISSQSTISFEVDVCDRWTNYLILEMNNDGNKIFHIFRIIRY